MANPPARQTPAGRSSRSNLIRLVGIVLLVIIFLVGLAALITWLVVRPKHLEYSIEWGSIRGYNLSQNNHLNSTFNFVLRAYNPNKRVSVYYDKAETWVLYENQKVAFNTLAPFFQPHRNETRLGVSLVAQDVALPGDLASDLRRERSDGKVELDIRMQAKIRFKVGVWKSAHRTLKVRCSPVVVRLSSVKNTLRKRCHVHT